MSPAVFEPAIPSSEWPKTHILDRAVTGIGRHVRYFGVSKHKNIINFARAQRLGWYGHIERMQETRMVKAIHSWKPISKRPTGRPKVCWEDDVKKRYTDVEIVKLEDLCPG